MEQIAVRRAPGNETPLVTAFVPGTNELFLYSAKSGVELWDYQSDVTRRVTSASGPERVREWMSNALCHLLVGRPDGPRWYLGGLPGGRIGVVNLLTATAPGEVLLPPGLGEITDIAYVSSTDEVLIVDASAKILRFKLNELVALAR
jgi:hypothetical protein